jgi:hypothetical protein
MYTINSQPVWVTDVVIDSRNELITHVPISENNRQIQNFVTEGTPVELQRSATGQFYISGLSDKQKGTVVGKTYKISDSKFGFTQGWQLKADGTTYETGLENEPTIGTEEEIIYYYLTVTVPLGSLDFGVDALGKQTTTRYPA